MYSARRTNRKKVLLWLLGGVLALGAGVGIYFYITTSQITEIENGETAIDETQTEGRVRLVASGDMMAHDTVNLRAETTDGGYDYLQFFEPIAPAFTNPDLVFCNQEGPSAGEDYIISGYPAFNAPQELSRDLARVGCNIINLANNHVADKGTGALAATLETWEEIEGVLAVNGANRSAAEQSRVSYFEAGGINFGFVAFAEFSNNTEIPDYAINIFSEELVEELVTTASENADFVIVSAHWGTEGMTEVNDDQRHWAELITSYGGDVILGTGPHVLQTVETVTSGDREALVWYSLGNMLSSQLQLNELIGGVASMDLEKTDDGSIEISNVAFFPTYMHYEWTESEAAAEELLARHNLRLYPLEEAAEPLARSQLETTVQAQMQRVESILNQYIEVSLVGLDHF